MSGIECNRIRTTKEPEPECVGSLLLNLSTATGFLMLNTASTRTLGPFVKPLKNRVDTLGHIVGQHMECETCHNTTQKMLHLLIDLISGLQFGNTDHVRKRNVGEMIDQCISFGTNQ